MGRNRRKGSGERRQSKVERKRCRPCTGERQFTGDTLLYSPLTTRTVRLVDSIPDSTWEEKEVGDNRRRSRRDDSAGKEAGIEDKSQVEKKGCDLVLTIDSP
ncbi:hypothetical protein PoB_007330600 [Plakobranchus ocellatus]|uniref:Uncharacterized protein n=1 Tax=Plakobranchus ocellatus TaxID=259542 RepID=A0AAV4DSJ9_9GAST|nr:hypothetical protein PoB_007330600 [Plakobranchus ocellatus]